MTVALTKATLTVAAVELFRNMLNSYLLSKELPFQIPLDFTKYFGVSLRLVTTQISVSPPKGILTTLYPQKRSATGHILEKQVQFHGSEDGSRQEKLLKLI